MMKRNSSGRMKGEGGIIEKQACLGKPAAPLRGIVACRKLAEGIWIFQNRKSFLESFGQVRKNVTILNNTKKNRRRIKCFQNQHFQ